MIERDFVLQKTKEYYIRKYIEEKLNKVGISEIRIKKIPLGEKIIISTSRPSLIVGSRGSNIKDLTKTLKKEFELENPQIEINEVKSVFLDANIVAEKIADSLERFGSTRFKSIGHKMMENVMNSGALGIEITISGKIPGARAKSWRFYQGYLKKCGDISVAGVRKAQKYALLKSGIVGIKVAIMPPDIELPDKIEILEEPVLAEEKKGEKGEKKQSAEKKEEKEKPTKTKSKLKKGKKRGKEETIAELKAEIEEPEEQVKEEKTEEETPPQPIKGEEVFIKKEGEELEEKEEN